MILELLKVMCSPPTSSRGGPNDWPHGPLSVLLVLTESICFQMEMSSTVFTDQGSRQQSNTGNKKQFQQHTPGEQVVQRGDTRQHWSRLDADEVIWHQAWKKKTRCFKWLLQILREPFWNILYCVYQWRQPWRREWWEYSVSGRSCLRTSLDSWERISGTAGKRTSCLCFLQPGQKVTIRQAMNKIKQWYFLCCTYRHFNLIRDRLIYRFPDIFPDI